MERAEQAVFDFKEKGKDALASAVKGMHLTQGLQKLQSSLHTVMLSMDQKIDRLGSMAEELHVAKGHLKNAFLKMNGKDTAKITERNPEQGIIFQTQKVLFQSMRSIHKLEQKTERLLFQCHCFLDGSNLYCILNCGSNDLCHIKRKRTMIMHGKVVKDYR